MAGVRTDQGFVDDVLDGWAEGVTAGRLAWRLNCTRGVVTGIVTRARRAGDPRAATRNDEPPFTEELLDAWAGGATAAVLAARFECSLKKLRGIIARANEAGDPRAGSLREKALADRRRQRQLKAEREAFEQEKARARAEQRELTEARREMDARERVNAEILAALAAEPRPAGAPWGFPNAASPGSMIGVEQAQERVVVDVTATFFGDPPPGRSALDMRGRG